MIDVTLQQFCDNPALKDEASQLVRQRDGLICFPCASTYRFGVSLLSEAGVLRLMQTKRRAGARPALVMVSSQQMVSMVADPIPPAAVKLMAALWPGLLTLRLPLRDDLPRKVFKELKKPDGKVGIRIPLSPTAARLVQEIGVPMLVSSANRSKKAGAGSVASIRSQFSPNIDMFIDAGDLPSLPPSTVVDFDKQGNFKVMRAGALSEERIRQVLAG